MRIILISLGMLVLHGTAHAASPLASCSTPPTLATPYNDLRLASDPRPPGHPVPLPIQVASTLLRAQADFLRRSDPALFADVTCAQMSKPTYRITLDNGTHIYVADLESNFGGFFLVAAFNPRTVQATADPWVVSNRFFGSIRDKDGYLNPPLVSGLDIHRNGHLDLVFEEQVHNGDVYNGQLYRYFDFGPKMELKPVLSLESQVEC